MIKYIKIYIFDSFVIVGNVGMLEGVRELENVGVDVIKVGIGFGRVCIIKIKIGFGIGGWQLVVLNICSKVVCKFLIVDGGIRMYGDIVKLIRFGVLMVMIGLLFVVYEELFGEIVEFDGKQYKEYFGSVFEF